MAILEGPRHVNLWPALPKPQPIEGHVDKLAIARHIAMAVNVEPDIDVSNGIPRSVESASSLGVFVFIKLDNGQEFEAHIIERTPRVSR